MISNSPNNPSAAKIKYLGLAGLLGAAIFFVSILILQIIAPEIDFFHGYISNYANGRYGSLFTAGIIIHGFTNLGIASGVNLAFRRSFRSAWTRAGLMLFAISSLGAILTGFFPTDLPGVKTAAGTTHVSIAAAGFVIELLALAFLAYGFPRESLWQSYALPTAIFAATGAIVLVWFVTALYTHAAPGAAERFSVAVFLLWEISTAWRLAVFPSRANNTYNG